MSYMSETAKVKDMPSVMKYITGRVADVGAGDDRIVPDAYTLDGRQTGDIQIVRDGLFFEQQDGMFDTVFSSHFLEHVSDPAQYLTNWWMHCNRGGHLVLYLPQKDAYNSHENPEHMFNWSYDDFMFWFKRSFCGEGKDFRGNHLKKIFEVVESGLDISTDRYSFYLIARAV